MQRAGNILCFAGAKGEEFETSSIGHGIFTYKFVVLGITQGRADDPSQNPHANGDGKVTLEEAFDYANHVQVPVVQGSKPGIVDPDRTKDVYLSR